VTDLEQAELRGHVKTCRTERDYVHPDRHWVMETYDTFSPQGQLVERRHRNPDGSSWSIVCRYDDQGRIREKEQDNQRLSYLYDSLGRLERVMSHSDQLRERLCESIQYAADGTIIKTSYQAPLDDEQRKTRSIAVSSMLHASLEAVVIMTVLDAADQPIRRVFYDAEDRVIRRVAFRYDQRGLLLEEGEVVGGAIREDLRNVYRYDAMGQRIETVQRWGDGLGGARLTFTYNDHGDVAQKIIEQDAGLQWEDGETGSQSWTEKFTYQYDDHGNWIQRSMQTIVEGAERLSVIERRELTYY
jgi:YD repeat-containing protein